MEIRRAERKKAKLRLGMSGPSGAGKTLSSLFLAYGITGDWEKIGFIDTEQKSGDLYAETEKAGIYIGPFLKIDLDPPYEPEKYVKAIKLLEGAGVTAIIIDSLTHAWAGDGGLLDIHGKIADSGRGNSFTAWRSVTPRHNALVDAILQSSSHIIATVRSKTEYVQQANDKGKTEIKKVGMAPIQRDGMEYEFTVFLDISHEHVATASKDRTSLFDGQYFKITPETGKKLLEWLETGKDAPDTLAPKPTQVNQPTGGSGEPKMISEAQLKALNTVISNLEKLGPTRDQIITLLKQKQDVGQFESTKELTASKASKAIEYVTSWIKAKGGN